MMFDKRRLHPIGILFNFIEAAKSLFLPLIFFLILGPGMDSVWIIVGVVLLFIVVNGIIGFLKWWRFTYWVEDRELRIEFGLFVKNKRFIPIERIQSIDNKAGIFHQLFKVVKLDIETAGGGGDAEASLTTVTKEEAELLRSLLMERKEAQEPNVYEGWETDQKVFSRKVTFLELVIAAATSGGVGVILSALFAFVFQLEEFIPDQMYESIYEQVISQSILFLSIASLILFVFLWALASLWGIQKQFGFTITRKGDDLVITRGLLEKVHLTVPVKKIQALRYHQNIGRQPLGYVSILAEVAGGGSNKETDFSTILFPIMKEVELLTFLENLLPEWELNTSWEPLPVRSRKRYLFRALILFVPIIVAVAWLIPAYLWIVLLAAGISVFFGYLRFKDGGYFIMNDFFSTRFRMISREVVITPLKRVQSISLKQQPFQKRAHLFSFEFSVISKQSGKDFLLKDLSKEQGDRIWSWYSRNRDEKLTE
ncbi:PH domain-containing protein [Bacillaceae bacterium S4-13-58]